MSKVDVEKLLNAIPLNVYWKDKNGVYVGCNISQATFFGFQSPADIIGKTDLELSGRQEAAKSWVENDQKIIQTGIPFIAEETGIFDNQKITTLSYKLPFKDDSGNIAGIMGISIDITAQKTLEERLSQEKKNAEIALENIIARLPGHVYWMDRHNKFLGCNDLQAKSAGLNSRFDIVGKDNSQMPWFDLADTLNTLNNQVMATGKEHVEEQEAQLADGTKRTFVSRKAPLLDEHGEVIGLLGISFDITDRKQMEEELIKSKNAAEAAARAKTEFLANMSHDMKTPLTGVVGMADLMAHDHDARDVDRHRAETIYACGLQAVSLFDSCLELSKMEMQEWLTHNEVFSLRKLLQDIQTLFIPRAQFQGLSFATEYDEALPEAVKGHRESLYRVLLNLVGNALKFTKTGGVILRALLTQPSDAQHISVELHVQDTGIGIPEDKHHIIFEKLRRLTPAYEGKIEGSGIGLYIVDQYVKRMKGTIQVKSRVGEGSTFIVSVPLTIAPKKILSEPQDMVVPLEVASTTKTLLSPPTINAESLQEKINTQALPHILLVEDMELIQFVTKSLLSNAGFAVDVASTGKEALAKFSAGKYDLIYMDIGLPDLDGYAVTQEMRHQEKLSGATTTPILALTGHGAVDVQAFCGKVGMQGVLSKPLTREQAEKVWQRYGKYEIVDVPGLTILESNQTTLSDNDILDLAATEQLLGSQQAVQPLLSALVAELENQFLPSIKVLMTQPDAEKLKFHLHKILGSLCYIKAPLLQQKLATCQKAIQGGVSFTENSYQEIEKEAERLIALYQKIQ
jgi:PAS domain S-box-containing protein